MTDSPIPTTTSRPARVTLGVARADSSRCDDGTHRYVNVDGWWKCDHAGCGVLLRRIGGPS